MYEPSFAVSLVVPPVPFVDASIAPDLLSAPRFLAIADLPDIDRAIVQCDWFCFCSAKIFALLLVVLKGAQIIVNVFHNRVHTKLVPIAEDTPQVWVALLH